MIHDLKPYPAYKDSGEEWLREVPEYWTVCSLGSLTSSVSQRGRPDLPLLSVVREKGVIPRSTMSDDENHNFIPDDLSNYKVVHAGNLVINKMKAWQGSLGIAPMDGIVSPAYFVFDFRIGDRRFGQALLRSRTYVAFFARASDGIRIGQWDLSIHGMKRIPVLVPPLPEQAAIVRFLDHVDRRIQRYIRAKQKLIALLNKQKQAIIHRAVTRGLDPNVRLKPSGVEWVGDVPEHWTVSRVKNEFECLNKRRVPLSSTERGAMKLRLFDYYGASGVIDRVDDYLFDDELLLIAEDGANLVLRNLPLAIIARGKFWVNNHAHILKPRRGNLDFLAGLMENFSYLPWISGAAQPKLTQDRLMSIPIVVPSPDEQDQIMRWATAETAPIRVAITQASRQIDLLREYRTRLIADVITGKLDVREAAAQLPEGAEEPEPLDDADALIESHEEAETASLDAAREEDES